jgi:hypothetical protein
MRQNHGGKKSDHRTPGDQAPKLSELWRLSPNPHNGSVERSEVAGTRKRSTHDQMTCFTPFAVTPLDKEPTPKSRQLDSKYCYESIIRG